MKSMYGFTSRIELNSLANSQRTLGESVPKVKLTVKHGSLTAESLAKLNGRNFLH